MIDGWMYGHFRLINLNGGVNFPNKSISAHESYGAAHDSQCQAEYGHVSEIEGRLEETIHLCLEKEVIK